MSNKRIPHPIYEVYECMTLNRIIDVKDGVPVHASLYRVKLYLIFSEGRVYTFYNPSDWVDNFHMIRECSTSASTFTHDLYVSPDSHPEIYNDIRNVLTSNTD